MADEVLHERLTQHPCRVDWRSGGQQAKDGTDPDTAVVARGSPSGPLPCRREPGRSSVIATARQCTAGATNPSGSQPARKPCRFTTFGRRALPDGAESAERIAALAAREPSARAGIRHETI
jgi:hypothetical protein